jgi:hypothetical protein
LRAPGSARTPPSPSCARICSPSWGWRTEAEGAGPMCHGVGCPVGTPSARLSRSIGSSGVPLGPEPVRPGPSGPVCRRMGEPTDRGHRPCLFRVAAHGRFNLLRGSG